MNNLQCHCIIKVANGKVAEKAIIVTRKKWKQQHQMEKKLQYFVQSACIFNLYNVSTLLEQYYFR